MKTTLLSLLAFAICLSAALMPVNANAQKTKKEKVIIRSSDGKNMNLESLRDTMIISKDGKDTTIIQTTQDGKEKKVTVKKIITSGDEKESTIWVDAETDMSGGDDIDQMVQGFSNDGKSCTIKVVKKVGKEGEPGTFIIKEFGPGGLTGDEDFTFDGSTCKKHSCVKVIRGDGSDFESDDDGKITVIYLNDGRSGSCCKMKKHRNKHQRIYIITED